MTDHRAMKRQRGAVLVEFAVVAFVLYLLLAALLSFGTMIQAAQVAQDVARCGSGELDGMTVNITGDFKIDRKTTAGEVEESVCD